MYARVAKFEGADLDGFKKAMAETRERVQAESGPPEGVPAKRLIMLADEEAGSSLAIVFFETEEDYRQGDQTLDSMGGGPGIGERTSVEKYEVVVEAEA